MLKIGSDFFLRFLSGILMCAHSMKFLVRGLGNQVKFQILKISEILRFLAKISDFQHVLIHIQKQIKKISVGIGFPTHSKSPKSLQDVWRAFMKSENRLKYGNFHQILTNIGREALYPIEDLHDGGEISKNHNCRSCLESDSGYGKNNISATSQKFLRSEISGARNFCHIAEISIFPYPE